MSAQSAQTANKLTLPDGKSLNQACKLSIKLSKPIDFYFYIDSCERKLPNNYKRRKQNSL